MNYHYEKIEESLAREMLRILGSDTEDYAEETIVGSDINQIRHIFYHLKSEYRSLTVEYMNENFRAFVISVDNTSLTLRVQDFREGPFRRCRIKFEAFRILYQFEVLILEIARDRIIIKMPYFIQTATRRMHKRVFSDDLFLKFNLKYRPFFDSRSDIQVCESRYPQIMGELRKDFPDIHLINRILTDEISAVSPHFDIIFYSDKTEQTDADRLMTEERKTVFLEDMNRPETLYEKGSLFRVINFHKHFETIKQRESEENALKYFEKLRREYLQEFTNRLVMAPIQIFDRVVGCIRVTTTILENSHISRDQAHQLDLLSSLFSYALSKTVIARTYFSHPVTRVKNISVSGLLFELENQDIFYYLLMNDHLKLNIQLKHSFITVNSEISRYFPSEKGFQIGVNFLDAEEDDFRKLEHFLFEKSTSQLARSL